MQSITPVLSSKHHCFPQESEFSLEGFFFFLFFSVSSWHKSGKSRFRLLLHKQAMVSNDLISNTFFIILDFYLNCLQSFQRQSRWSNGMCTSRVTQSCVAAILTICIKSAQFLSLLWPRTFHLDRKRPSDNGKFTSHSFYKVFKFGSILGFSHLK